MTIIEIAILTLIAAVFVISILAVIRGIRGIRAVKKFENPSKKVKYGLMTLSIIHLSSGVTILVIYAILGVVVASNLQGGVG
ncbi:MAG: hypothetical protein FWH20_07610 [Oscillospiraceae bacterium]|nr:hypothetical protein [Oscillospiraceae bacterium]